MTNRAVHWCDGMFLRAQHFQAAERYAAQAVFRRQMWANPYCWGVGKIDVDDDALANNKFVVRALRACFQDGTAVDVPEDWAPTTLDIRSAFPRASQATVYLAVPVLDLSKQNAAPRATESPFRYFTETQTVADENSGTGAEPIQFRSLNVRLLLSTDDHTGYDVLPIARLVQSEDKVSLDPDYYPPLLTTGAWPPFPRLVKTVYEKVRSKMARLAVQLEARRGVASEWATNSAAQLRALNEAAAVLGVVGFTPGAAPLATYTELCRVVGLLSYFGPTRTVAELPPYEHEDLGPRVLRVKAEVDRLLGLVVEPEYKERRFVGEGLHLQADLDPTWAGKGWRLFIGVQSSLSEDDLRALLTDGSRFGLKVGSGPRVDDLYRLGVPGLNLVPAARPDELPAVTDEVLLAVERDGSREWEYVGTSNTLGLRFNEKLVIGSLAKERVVTLGLGTKSATVTFTLYAVPAAAADRM